VLGVSPDAIEVKLDENVLTVSVERKTAVTDEKKGFLRRERNSGTFTRSFTIDGSKPDAAYRHGVLTLNPAPERRSAAEDVQGSRRGVKCFWAQPPPPAGPTGRAGGSLFVAGH